MAVLEPRPEFAYISRCVGGRIRLHVVHPVTNLPGGLNHEAAKYVPCTFRRSGYPCWTASIVDAGSDAFIICHRIERGRHSHCPVVGRDDFLVGLINWLARHAEESMALRAILYGNLCIHVVGTVIDVIGITSGAVGSPAWGSVVLHVILGGFFAKFAFAKPQLA